MSFLKQYGTSAKGNDRLLKQYGGNAGSSPMARQHYATGGAVKSKEGNPSLSEGLSAADGAPAKPSLARPGRKMGGKAKDGKKGTTVNIVIAGKGPDAGAAGGPPAPGPGGPPPMMKGPPPPMPMPPPGAGPGGPPPPMLKARGGAVARYAKGGRIKRDTGGEVEMGRTSGSTASGQPKSLPPRSLSGDRDSVKPKDGITETMRKHGGAVGKYATGGRIANLGKFAHGGKVRKKFATDGWVGEGDSGKAAKEKSAALSADADKLEKNWKGDLGSAATTTALGLMGPKMKAMGPVGKALKTGVVGTGLLGGLATGLGKMAAGPRRQRAEEASKEGDEAEGRKEGGRAIGLREKGKLVGAGGAAGRLAKLKMYGK